MQIDANVQFAANTNLLQVIASVTNYQDVVWCLFLK